MSNSTLLVSVDVWDILTDASGNIARADPPYALAQDVASAIKTFLGECYYDTTLGIPYFQQILGQTPPLTVFSEYMIAAALTVPGVVSATVSLRPVVGRTVSGQVQFVDTSGKTTTLSI